MKWIIFSDHHRGIGDGADDFRACKESYLKALPHYYENDFELILLGDVEEFWENAFKRVISSYKDVMLLEKAFYDKNNLIKVWGNHDDDWQYLINLKEHLFPFFNNIKAHEGLDLSIKLNEKEVGKIFLVHGHQGTSASDRFAFISKWFVRNIWRNFQRLFKVPLSTPSKSKELKSAHDIAMFNWASRVEKQLLICGHTHQPVFMSRNHVDVLEKRMAELKKMATNSNLDQKQAIDKELAQIRIKTQKLKKQTEAIGTLITGSKPCYFNTGCCSFSDGDITGIEIEQGDIRLVKWDREGQTIIIQEKLNKLFDML